MEDIWVCISTFIHKGDWISFITTCKLFNSFNSLEEVRKRANHGKTIAKFLYNHIIEAPLSYRDYTFIEGVLKGTSKKKEEPMSQVDIIFSIPKSSLVITNNQAKELDDISLNELIMLRSLLSNPVDEEDEYQNEYELECVDEAIFKHPDFELNDKVNWLTKSTTLNISLFSSLKSDPGYLITPMVLASRNDITFKDMLSCTGCNLPDFIDNENCITGLELLQYARNNHHDFAKLAKLDLFIPFKDLVNSSRILKKPVKWDDILEFINEDDIDYKVLSSNPLITFDIVIANSYREWDFMEYIRTHDKK